jgi:hypothetical protein
VSDNEHGVLTTAMGENGSGFLVQERMESFLPRFVASDLDDLLWVESAPYPFGKYSSRPTP